MIQRAGYPGVAADLDLKKIASVLPMVKEKAREMQACVIPKLRPEPLRQLRYPALVSGSQNVRLLLKLPFNKNGGWHPAVVRMD